MCLPAFACLVFGCTAFTTPVFETSRGATVPSNNSWEALRESGAVDLGCDAQRVKTYLARTSPVPAMNASRLYVADGCNQRATYALACGAEVVVPNDATAEDAAKRRAEGDKSRVCRFLMLSRMTYSDAP